MLNTLKHLGAQGGQAASTTSRAKRVGVDSSLNFRTENRAAASIAGVLWSFANVSVAVFLTAAVFLVTSRVLTPAEFGAVALASAIVSLIAALIPAAFGESLVQRAELRQSHVDSVFWLTGFLAVAATVCLVVSSPALARLTGTPLVASILPVLSLRLVFDAGMTVPAALIQRRMQFRYIAVRTTLANGAGAALCIWMVFQGHALWALVLAQVVTSFAALVITLLAAAWRPGVRFEMNALADLKHFGLFAMGGRILNEARLDQLLMGLVLGPAVLGIYFFARRLFQMLRDLTAGVFAPVVNVLLASMQAEREIQREFYLAACFASASLAFPLFAGLIALAPDAIPLIFGEQWSAAVFPVQCFGVVGLLAGLGIMQAGLIRYLGQPSWWFWYQSVMQLSTLPLVLLLFPLGLNAIMVAMVVRTLLLWPISVLKAQSMLGLPLSDYLRYISPPAAAALVMALVAAQLPSIMTSAYSWGAFMSQFAIGAAIYAALLSILGRPQIRTVLRLYRMDNAQAS